METKIYTLHSHGSSCSGYATVASAPGGITVSFSIKSPPDELTCLYCEGDVFHCGIITQGRKRIQAFLRARGARPSFGVFKGSSCVMSFGADDDIDKMRQYLCGTDIPEQYNDDDKTYYQKNRDFFTSLLDTSPRIKALESIMPNSIWIKAPEGCIMGFIKDENSELLYICYGIEGSIEQQIPQELTAYCSWLKDPISSNGWWVIYQCPKTGEALRI